MSTEIGGSLLAATGPFPLRPLSPAADPPGYGKPLKGDCEFTEQGLRWY